MPLVGERVDVLTLGSVVEKDVVCLVNVRSCELVGATALVESPGTVLTTVSKGGLLGSMVDLPWSFNGFSFNNCRRYLLFARDGAMPVGKGKTGKYTSPCQWPEVGQNVSRQTLSRGVRLDVG